MFFNIIKIIKIILHTCSFTLSKIFGKIQWQPPKWLVSLQHILYKCLPHRKKTTIISAFIGLLVIAGGVGVWYYNNLPQPDRVYFSVINPRVTDYATQPISIAPLNVRFNGSVAPIEQINKTVGQGISISPAIEGTWFWASDSSLQFSPKNDWPIQQNYNVTFAKKGLVTASALLNTYNFSFTSAAFAINDISAYIYEDPADPLQKKLVATVSFSHPIDRAQFAAHVQIELSKGLTYRDNNNPIKPQILFSENGLEAYIHSAQLGNPLEDSQVTLNITKGVQALAGGNTTSQDVSTKVDLPGRYKLSFDQGKITFVDDKDGNADSILIFESSSAISDSEIADKVTAWELPHWMYEGYRPVSRISEELLAQSEKLTLTHIPTSNGQSTIHAFKLKAEPQEHVFVQIAANVESVNGYIAKDKKVIFSDGMPNYPEQLSFLSQGSLLSLNGYKELGVVGRGIREANVEIARILPHQLHHLVNQLNGDFKRPDMSESDFDQLVEREDFYINFYNAQPDRAQYESIDISEYLNYENGRKGIFVLRLSPSDKYDKQTLGRTSTTRDIRFIVVTDIGIIAKRSADGNHKIFIQSISSGEPIKNAKVEIWGVNGQPIMTAYSDNNGFAQFDDTSSYTRENRPLMYVVSKDQDLSFLPIERTDRILDYSRFNVGGLTEEGESDTLRAFMFSDRGLYRPGETAQVGMIVRANDWSGKLNGLPVSFSIIDPRGKTILNKYLTLSNEAFETVEVPTDKNAPAGTYTATLSLPENIREDQDRLLGSVDFSVRDFEPDRMKVTASLNDSPVKAWLKPEEVEAKINAIHLFGAPASDRLVTLDMHLSPAFASFDSWSDYRFYIADTLNQSTDETLQEQKTDENGQVIFDLDLKRFTARAYNVQIYAKVFEANGGRNVAAEARSLVSSSDMMLGVKSVDDLNFIRQNAVRKVNWLAINQDLASIPASNLTRELSEITYVSVLVKQKDGTYHYQSRRQNKLLLSSEISITENGFEDNLDTSQAGSFVVSIKKGNETLNQITYTVTGNSDTSRSLDRNAELQLRLDKNNYTADEDIAISINAPYTGAGLITIERDDIYAFQWFKADTTNSVQHIRLPKGLEGNAYINVQFVRSPSSDEIYMSPLSYGVVPFSINLDERQIETHLQTPKTVKPGDIIPIKVSLNKPARVVVYGADEGILQVARYQQPKPLNYFFEKRALEVTTSQILDLILPEFSNFWSAAGGDDQGLSAMHINPFKRLNKPPMAWWSGLLSLPAGETELEWQVPDYFNGKVRLFAVAVDEQHIGTAQTTTDIRGPVVISPNIPSFVAPDDKVYLNAGIFSNLTDKAAINIYLQTDDGLNLQDAKPIKLEIDPNHEKTANFLVNIGNVLGNHELKFIAELPDGQIISYKETLSVRPAIERRVSISAGLFHENQKQLTLERNLYSQYRNVEFGTAGSPLVWGQALSQYLDNYDYLCTEQTVSKAMPHIILDNASKANAVLAFQDALKVLDTRQNSEGGFGIWTATPESDPFVSLYVADFFLDAKEQGFALPSHQWNRSLKYLTYIAKKTTSGLDELRNRAYAIYLLTRSGTVTGNELSALTQQLNQYFTAKDYENDVLSYYIAASYKMMKLDEKQQISANQIFEKQNWALLSPHFARQNAYLDALSTDAIKLTLLAKYAPEQLKRVPEALMVKMGEALRQQNYNSFSAALLIRALDAYDRALPQNMQVTTMAETDMGEKNALIMENRPQRASLAPNIKKLLLQKEQSQSAGYYFLSEAGYDTSLPKEPIINGLEITHEYLSLDGKPINSVKVGDEFLVKISYRTMNSQFFGELALVDLLPGGTEIVYRPTQQTYDDDSDDYGDDYGDDFYSQENSGWQYPIGEEALSDWLPNFIDTRDDRVVFYGWPDDKSVSVFTYRLRAVSAGEYATPPAFIESMYQPEFHGLSIAGHLTITQNEQVE